MSERLRDPRADLVRATAAVAVVLLHLSDNTPPSFDLRWWAGSAVQSVTRAAVPLFVLLSGALLLRPNPEPPRLFFLKRFRKLIVPLAFWSAIYLAWRHFYYGSAIDGRVWLDLLLGRPAYYHLWFFYMIAALALFVPWLRAQVDFTPRRSWMGFFGAWLAALAVPPAAHFALGIALPPEYFAVPGYGGFFILGPVLAAWRPPPATMRLVLIGTLAAAVATLVGTFLLTARPAARSGELLDYLKPNIAVLSVGLFVLLWHEAPSWSESGRWRRGFEAASRGSLTVYVLHPLVCELGGRGQLGSWFIPVGMIVQGAAVVAICLAVWLVLSRIPLLRAVVP